MTIRKADLPLPTRTPAYVDREIGAAELRISPETWDTWVEKKILPEPSPGFPASDPRWRWEDVKAAIENRNLNSPEHPGWVYFIRCIDRVKIGYASDIAKRVAGLQTACPYPLSVLATVPGSIDVERQMHRGFADLREVGEWFRYEGALSTYIDDLVNQEQGVPAG